jgi:UDP-glucose:glycoprotein glucosyltransferase
MSSDDKLDALQHLSQDLPKYSAALSRHVQVSEPVKAKLQDLYNMGPMDPAVYLNGKPFSGTELNAFSSAILRSIQVPG